MAKSPVVGVSWIKGTPSKRSLAAVLHVGSGVLLQPPPSPASPRASHLSRKGVRVFLTLIALTVRTQPRSISR